MQNRNIYMIASSIDIASPEAINLEEINLRMKLKNDNLIQLHAYQILEKDALNCASNFKYVTVVQYFKNNLQNQINTYS